MSTELKDALKDGLSKEGIVELEKLLELAQQSSPEQANEWRGNFDERQLKEIDFCIVYRNEFNHGTDGHILRTIIAEMASILGRTDNDDSYLRQGSCGIAQEFRGNT